MFCTLNFSDGGERGLFAHSRGLENEADARRRGLAASQDLR